MAILRTVREIRRDLFSIEHDKQPKTITLFGKQYTAREASSFLFNLEHTKLLTWSKHKDKIEIS